MKFKIVLIILFLLPAFFIQSLKANLNNSNQTEKMKTNSMLHCAIGTNMLIAEINKEHKATIELLNKPYSFNELTKKITELGTFLNYGIVGTNDMLGTFAAYDSIVEKFISDLKIREKFYEKVNKVVGDGKM